MIDFSDSMGTLITPMMTARRSFSQSLKVAPGRASFGSPLLLGRTLDQFDESELYPAQLFLDLRLRARILSSSPQTHTTLDLHSERRDRQPSHHALD